MKWEVDEHFALPRLDDIVAGADVERHTVHLDSTYYDTADGDLQAHGVLLRRRDGDDDTGWQLKVPDAEGRVEIRTALSDTLPSELADMLTGMRLGKPLVNVATIRTTRDRYRITDPKRQRLCAELDDDRVHASSDHRLLAWREIEVELAPAARSASATPKSSDRPAPTPNRPRRPRLWADRRRGPARRHRVRQADRRHGR
jgi:inorganic triphosphatase YgiF